MAVTALVLSIISLCTGAGLLVGGLTACVLGIVAAVRASKNPQEYGGMPLAITAIVISVLSFMAVPIIAAIAIPSLLRARISANESAAISDLRTMISAQMAYQGANRGFYDSPECLARPGACIPGYPASGPTFLDPALASAHEKMGYVRTFHAGSAPAQLDPAIASRTSLTGYVYLLVPAVPGRTGIRGFCGDHNGAVCFTYPSAPTVVEGACPPPPDCLPLR